MTTGREYGMVVCSVRVPLKRVRARGVDGVVRLDDRTGVRTACELAL